MAGAELGYLDVALRSGPASPPPSAPTGESEDTYDVTVSLFVSTGSPVVTPQASTVNVTSCGTYTTPAPVILGLIESPLWRRPGGRSTVSSSTESR